MGQSGTPSKKVAASSDADINGLLEGSAWDHVVNGMTVLTWSEPTSSSFYSSYSSTTLTGVSTVTSGEDANIRSALNEWAAVANLVFNPITETSTTHADLRFAQAATNPDNNPNFFGGSGVWPDGKTLSDLPGDTFFHASPTGAEAQLLSTAPGSWGNHVARHEIGHDLGLKHAFDDNSQLGATGATGVKVPANHDSWEYTIMTYHAYSGAPNYIVANRSDAGSYAQSLMMDDIEAIQYLYGADFTTNSGDTRYTFDPNTGQMFVDGVGQGTPLSNKIFRTIWDGGGKDTYDLSNYTTSMTIDLRPGQWSTFSTAQLADLGQSGGGDLNHAAIGNVANALLYQGDARSLIENAIGGSGNDTITGNAADNTFTGDGGNDTEDGGDGNDIAVFSGSRRDHLATLLASGAITIADQRAGSDGTDTLSNIERFRFDDGTFNQIEVLNRAPVIAGDVGPHVGAERSGVTNLPPAVTDVVSGSLSFTDGNIGDTHTASRSFLSATWSGGVAIPVATMAAFAGAMTASITADGTGGTLGWSFAISDQLLDFLAFSETLTLTFHVSVADHHVGSSVSDSDTEAVIILLNGANDVPTLVPTSALTGTIAELTNTTGSAATDSTPLGIVAFTDPDLNDRPTATLNTAGETVTWQDATHNYTAELTAAQIATLEAAVSIGAEAGNTNTGKIDWQYDIVDKNLDFLGVSESLTVTAPIVIDDHNGGVISQNVVITINGANDNPIAATDSNGTPKKSILSVSAVNGLLSNDTDPDSHDQGHLFVGAVSGSAANVGHTIAGTYGSVVINADGSYIYTADKGGLPSKIVAQDTFIYAVADEHGGTDTSTLSIIVSNPNVNYISGANTTLIGGNGSQVLDGSAGHDVLMGGNSPDVLVGGIGDTLTGGNGPDTFLFRPHFGANIITDFDFNNDMIQLDKSIFSSITDLLNHTTDTAGGAVINNTHGDTITLTNITLQQLQTHQNEFYLV